MKTRITFSKMEPNTGVAGDGAVMDAINCASGDFVAQIEMHQVRVEHGRYRPGSYEVIVWAAGVDGREGGKVAASKVFGVAGIGAYEFPCKYFVTTGDYDNPRTALAAAKRWIREEVTA